jgi:hypothetical protein
VSADSSSYDTISLGNGINDLVSADSSSYDIIALGNGAGDTVNTNGVGVTGSEHTQSPSVMATETP